MCGPGWGARGERPRSLDHDTTSGLAPLDHDTTSGLAPLDHDTTSGLAPLDHDTTSGHAPLDQSTSCGSLLCPRAAQAILDAPCVYAQPPSAGFRSPSTCPCRPRRAPSPTRIAPTHARSARKASRRSRTRTTRPPKTAFDAPTRWCTRRRSMLGLARALAAEGKYVEAQESYNRIIREGLPPGSPDVFKRALDDAKKEVDAVAPKVAAVTITVKAAGGADIPEPQVVLDEHAINSASLGVRRAIDPGAHVLRATAEGYKPGELKFSDPEGGSVDEPLSLEKDLSAPGRPAPRPVPGTRRRPAWPSPDRDTPAQCRRCARSGPGSLSASAARASWSAASRASSPSASTRRCQGRVHEHCRRRTEHPTATTRWAPSRPSASSWPASAARPAAIYCLTLPKSAPTARRT